MRRPDSLFVAREWQTSPDQIAYLSSVLRDMWEAKLRIGFPGRRFNVELQTAPVDEVSEWLITFYQH
jgi:hypothetical protein